MAASGLAVFVDHAESDDAEPIVGGEGGDGRAEDITVECAIVGTIKCAIEQSV